MKAKPIGYIPTFTPYNDEQRRCFAALWRVIRPVCIALQSRNWISCQRINASGADVSVPRLARRILAKWERFAGLIEAASHNGAWRWCEDKWRQ
jgi:hypothetical protein